MEYRGIRRSNFDKNDKTFNSSWSLTISKLTIKLIFSSTLFTLNKDEIKQPNSDNPINMQHQQNPAPVKNSKKKNSNKNVSSSLIEVSPET